jgi:hypothetical protein
MMLLNGQGLLHDGRVLNLLLPPGEHVLLGCGPVEPSSMLVLIFAMTFQEFTESLTNDHPPADLSLALAGLWWDAKGNWSKAHESAQQDERPPGSWVHAYLHRKEGDNSNAGYWYRRAGKPHSQSSLDQEWKEIAQSLLAQAES